MSDEDPCGRAFDCRFEVFCEPSALREPGEGAFDDPSSGQELEAFDAGWSLDDVDVPGSAVCQGVEQLGAAIDAVGEDVAQAG